jgi:hypothetical protein
VRNIDYPAKNVIKHPSYHLSDRNGETFDFQKGESTRKGAPGRFFDSYCNWQRFPEYAAYLERSGRVRHA